MRNCVVVLTWAVLLCWPVAAQGQTRTVRLSEPLQSPEPLAPADNGILSLSLSGDGNTAVFTTARSTLVEGDTNRTGSNFGTDVFIRNVASGVTRRILGVGGAQPNGDADRNLTLTMTRDGRYVFFESEASNLVPNDPNGSYLSTFRHDLATGVTTLVDIPYFSHFKVSGNGRYLGYRHFTGDRLLDLQTGVTVDFLRGNLTSSEYHLSFDGRLVAFRSSHVAGVYSGSHQQVFVQNLDTGAYELISRRPDGGPGNNASYDVAISDNGQYVAFDSLASDLVADDTNGRRDVFLHDRATGQTTRVSVTAAGSQRTTDNSLPAISPDGAVVAFVSAVPDACSLCPVPEVVVYDRNIGSVSVASVASDGFPANGGSANIITDQRGRYVAFTSGATNLVRGDTNGGIDVFLRDRGPTPACSYQVSPTVIDIGAAGGTVPVTLTTTAGCGWGTTLADAWVSLSAVSGTGPATVMVALAANPGVSRFGWGSIEGRRFLVRQAGPRATAPPEFELPGVPPGGVTFPRGTYADDISADGRFVLFRGGIRLAQSGDTITRVYLRDRLTGATIDVSGAPGGPVNNPAHRHDTAGVSSPEGSVLSGYGSSLSEDGRFVYFRPYVDGVTDLGCYVFDRLAGASTGLPTDLGRGTPFCPSMSVTGRFFSGVLPNSKTVRIYDLTTQQTASFTFPGIPAADTILSVVTSRSARYVVVRVSEYVPGCTIASCRAYTAALDRLTGATARTLSSASDNQFALLRLRLLDPLWTEFGVPRHYSQFNDSLTSCELIDRQTQQRTPFPQLPYTNSSFSCGLAANNGQQILFITGLDFSPGDLYRDSPELHVYTRATGAVSRLGTLPNGESYFVTAGYVSQNGRYLLGSTTSGHYYNSQDVTDVVVLDLGVGSDPVDGTAPSNLQATVTGTAVQLAWSAPAQATPTSYVIEAGSTAGASNLAVFETGNTATSLATTAPPGVYYVRVRARSGGALGSPSNEAIVSSYRRVLGAGHALRLTHTVNGSSVQLSWQAAAGAATYVLEAGSATGLSNLLVSDTGSAATTLTATAPPGTYYVRMRARNACGSGAASNETVVTVGGGCAAPAAPGNLTASVNGRTVTLVWSAAAGSVAGYTLEAGYSPGATNAAVLDVGSGTALTATAPPGTYYVRVRARNACGPGPATNEVVVQVP